MKKYVNVLKDTAFSTWLKLQQDKETMKRLLVQPEIGDKIKVVRWDFIKLKYKYELIRKLDYDICSICDLEKFYDIVFEINL